ncbi:SUN domain-containing protein 1 isoform X6 [Falco peregrinus]|uniref:SUN domain-containing protein 1 isoform X6 n=1 Tax=Falco peregrinus TaxID=8954 RepID=UPI00247A3A0A|nr:SUN domain-containing protein 1 isoform X6 [Falco peregrinus]
MSRRSLRLAAAGFSKSEEAQNDALRDSSYAGNFSFREHSSKMAKQHRSTNKRSGSARQTPRRTLSSSSIFSQSSFNSHAGDSSMDVLDESLIQERTEVGHFWGLDEEGDPKVSDAAPIQGNGDVATTEAETSMINGYTCSGCSMLSERKEVLTAHSASPVPSSTIYSRDRSRKHAYTNSDYCGSMNVKEFYREDSHLGVNEESICYFMLHVLRTVGATGWLVSQKVLSLLWLAILSPGRAASGMFSLLRTRWYQLVTLMSLPKVVLLKRCLPKTYKLLLFLIPLLFLLGIGFWGFGGSISLLPSLSWTRTDRIGRIDDYTHLPEPQADSSHSGGCTKDTMTVFDAGRISQLEKQVAFMSDRCHHSDEEYSKVLLLLRNLQDQVAQMSDKSETLKLIKNVVGQHLKDKELEEKTDFLALHKEHQLRILTLEELLGKLSTESKDIQKELDAAKAKPVRDDDEHNQLLSRIKKLELELTQMKSELLTGESVKTSCEKLDVIPEKVDAWVKEYVKLMLFGDQQEDFPESLLQWLMSNFVSQNDLQTLLQDLEFQILKNITLHMSVTNQKLTSEVVTNAVTNAGISGITEAQVQIIVNNALKLYSQDKIGMVDFALESGGGSIVSTRCSETYETKTALFSLFGIPLWYMSQSPRVVIQPDIHPGNCWAFRGSPGYLVVKLSMKIYPTAFTVEHIPKTLSPTGNITSAPKNFSVYGLDDEYQEDGTLLGQYVYDQEGEPLQMFPVMEKSEKTFQIVELRIFSNWGHEKYTCLYRFRVHGKPAE